LLKKKKDDSYELFFSFWPKEPNEKNKHSFGSFEKDMYWQRFGVPSLYGKNKEITGFRDMEDKDNRKAHGVLGIRTPYVLPPEVIIHFPHGFNLEGTLKEKITYANSCENEETFKKQ
jgi:hypothetical protein